MCRMVGVKTKEKAKIMVEIEQNIDLVAPASSRIRQQTNVTSKSVEKEVSKNTSGMEE